MRSCIFEKDRVGSMAELPHQNTIYFQISIIMEAVEVMHKIYTDAEGWGFTFLLQKETFYFLCFLHA